MRVKIKRIDESLPLPKYETSGAVAFDLLAREKIEIAPHAIERIPTNIIVEIPKGYMLFLKDRSSTAKKKNLIHTAGIIDQDFRGEKDEILIQFYNFSDQPVVVEKGERIGQASFVRVDIAEWDEVDSMSHNKTRGGFGSTG